MDALTLAQQFVETAKASGLDAIRVALALEIAANVIADLDH